MKTMLVIPGIAGLALVGYGIKIMLSGTDESDELSPGGVLDLSLQPCPSAGEEVEKRKLEEICHIWEGNRIPLAKLAVIWRDVDDDKLDTKRPRPKFKHPGIDAFFTKYVDQPVVKGRRRIVVEKLLIKLDMEGDCPSVVGYGAANKNEKEGGYAKNTYEYLAAIPLWKHSLTVAEQLISKLAYKVMIPDALIMALGHDIGKIPAQYRSTYTQADHPEISVLVLNSFPDYLNLNNHAELSKIIKSHHYMVQNMPMATSLKVADQDARKLELAGFVTEEEKPQQESEVAPSTVPETAPEETRKEEPPPPQPPIPPIEESESLLDTESQPKKYVPQEMKTLPVWLDLGAVLSSMEKYINVVEKSPDLKLSWHAISVKEGFVWIKEELLWKTINEVAGSHTDLIAASADEAAKRDWLYSVVRELGKRDHVVMNMIKDGYFMAPCTLITGKGRAIPSLLIPFYASAFGQLPSELEKRKGSTLYKIVKQIIPKYQNEASK